jgi:3-hydroxymyristoyl/3-hydroxydecanoyl-(acyl carrier protein) dehydratase
MSVAAVFETEDILRLLPHRPPFLFVDRIVKFSPGRSIVAERDLDPGESFFAGHFPGRPIMPGVLVTDALAQTAGLLWGFSQEREGERGADQPKVFFLASANMKYVNPAVPGETLRLTATSQRSFGGLFNYEVEAAVGRKAIAKGSLTLAISKEQL